MLSMPRLVSLLVITALVVILGITFYRVVAPFLMPLFLAGVFAILSQPIYRRMQGWTNGRTTLAAALTTAAVPLLVLAPLVLGTMTAAVQLKSELAAAVQPQDGPAPAEPAAPEEKPPLKWRDVARTTMDFIKSNATVQSLVKRYGDLTGQPVAMDEIEREVDERLREGATVLARKTLGSAGPTLSLLGTAARLLIGGLTFLLALFYFLADGPALIEGTIALVPVHQDYQRALITQFEQAVRAVVTATFAAALGQGIATAVGMSLAGFGHFFIVMLLATLTALVPLLGTWLVWAPYVVYLWTTGDRVAATLLSVYCIVFVGLLDNVIRTYVLQSNVKLHPLLAFVSVLGGIQVLGLWGLFIGPIVASCLYALLRIFNTELTAFSHDRSRGPAVDPEASTVALPGNAPALPVRPVVTESAAVPPTTGPRAAAGPTRGVVDSDASTVVMNRKDVQRLGAASPADPAAVPRPAATRGPGPAQ